MIYLKWKKNIRIAVLLFLLTTVSILSNGQAKISSVPEEFTFGIITDVHADMLPDGKERMTTFINEAKKVDADMIIQLGDFCRPRENEKFMMESWNNFTGPKFHVLGNHDMDFNVKNEVVEYWGMPAPYYSFDQGNFHFIVLDANYLYKDGKYIDYANANFYVDSEQRAYINPEQIEWLKNDLQKTDKPTFIFSHQSLINVLWGIKNRVEIQKIFESANKDAGFKKVIACFNGHDHVDFHREINGIHYFEINSVGYQWMGNDYPKDNCYDTSINAEFKHIDKIAVYKDPLFAFVTIKNNELIIKGVQSEWFCESPSEKGIPENIYGCRLSPAISNYSFKLNQKTTSIKLMTWNIWHGGLHGDKSNDFNKDTANTINVLKVLQQESPDILFMQETYCCGMDIAKLAGYSYSQRGSSNLSIHSKYPIIDSIEIYKPFNSHAVIIDVNGQHILCVNLWLHYLPDYFQDIKKLSPDSLILAEGTTRLKEITAILNAVDSLGKSLNLPIIIGGDFNSGSHLDWVESTKKSHYNKIVEWPVSKLMSEQGYTDSFRDVNPDPTKTLEGTWGFLSDDIISDRIDFIYNKGEQIKTKYSKIVMDDPVGGFFNSDHRAILSIFELEN